MKDNKNSIEHILEVEGVKAQGYGIIPQAVMFDRSLPAQSKAIYAYFVSYTGSGRTIFPKRETILADLKMSKNAYYKYFNPLVENGYIKISKAKGFKNKNVYTICDRPPLVKCDIESEESESLLSLDGINANGFGFIPKLIMCDRRLSVKSKALIAFLYSIVQSGCRAFPHRSTICVFLGLSKDTYYKALNELIKYNYITVKQRHAKNGRFAVNDYILNSNPVELPRPENEDISEEPINTNVLPRPENKDIQEKPINTEVTPCPKNEDVIKSNRVWKFETLPCQENCDNNNITSNNSTDNISSSNLNGSYIPRTQNENEIRQMIYSLARFSEYSENKDEFSRKYCKTVKALVEMLCVKDYSLYAKRIVKTKELFDFLNDCILEDTDGLSLRDLIMQTVWHYESADNKYVIKRPTEYLKSLLWDEIYNFNL